MQGTATTEDVFDRFFYTAEFHSWENLSSELLQYASKMDQLGGIWPKAEASFFSLNIWRVSFGMSSILTLSCIVIPVTPCNNGIKTALQSQKEKLDNSVRLNMKDDYLYEQIYLEYKELFSLENTIDAVQ